MTPISRASFRVFDIPIKKDKRKQKQNNFASLAIKITPSETFDQKRE